MSTNVASFIENKRGIQTIKQMSRDLMDGDEPSPQEVLDFFSKAAKIVQNLPEYDVIGMDQLVGRLRDELKRISDRTDGLNSLNKLSAKTGISRTYLAKFRDGGSVCMNIMNRIAREFQVRYLIENYEDNKGNID